MQPTSQSLGCLLRFSKEIATRRHFLSSIASASTVVLTRPICATEPARKTATFAKAQIAITLDLEMSRNFPEWQNTHWDYEKGNLNQAAKDYAVAACRRVKERGGVIHNFVVGQALEQANVDWLKEIAQQGHPIGNHTYDHVYLLASSTEELQYRFRRAPWLLRDRSVSEVLRENIKLTNLALKERIGVEANGFRTPGGFATGLSGREDLQQLILDLGFNWVSCRYPAHAAMEDLHATNDPPSQTAYDNILAAQSEAQPFLYPTGLLEVPMSPVSDIGAFRTGRWKLDYFLQAIRTSVRWAIEHKAMFDFLAHISCLGIVDPGFQAIDLICDLVDQSDGQAEIVGLDTIAKRSRQSLAG